MKMTVSFLRKRYVLATVVLLIIFGALRGWSIYSPLYAPLSVAGHLLVGWSACIVRSFPYVAQNCPVILGATAVLATLCLGTHHVIQQLRHWLKPGSRPWNIRQGFNLITLALLPIMGSGLMIKTADHTAQWTSQYEIIAPYKGKITWSISNVRQMATAVAIYAADNDGRYPDDLDVLERREIISPGTLVRLNRAYVPDPVPSGFIYLKGLDQNTPSNVPLFISAFPFENGKYVIAYNDQEARLETVTEREAALQRWREYRGAALQRGGNRAMTTRPQHHKKEAGIPSPRCGSLLTGLSMQAVNSPEPIFPLCSSAGQECPASFLVQESTLKGGPPS